MSKLPEFQCVGTTCDSPAPKPKTEPSAPAQPASAVPKKTDPQADAVVAGIEERAAHPVPVKDDGFNVKDAASIGLSLLGGLLSGGAKGLGDWLSSSSGGRGPGSFSNVFSHPHAPIPSYHPTNFLQAFQANPPRLSGLYASTLFSTNRRNNQR